MIYVLTGTHANLNIKPNNAAVIEGQEVVFTCNNDVKEEYIQWYFSASAVSQKQSIFTGTFANSSFEDRFTVRRYGQNYDLKIIDTRATDAGVYTCEETGTFVSWSADLSVLGKQSFCNLIV